MRNAKEYTHPELGLLHTDVEVTVQSPAAEVLGPVRVLVIENQQREVLVLVEGRSPLCGALDRSSCFIICVGKDVIRDRVQKPLVKPYTQKKNDLFAS